MKRWLAGVWALGAACGTAETTPPPPPSGYDACTVIAAEDVRDVLQFTPGAPRPDTVGEGVTRCVWPTPDGRQNRLVVEFSEDAPRSDADAWLERTRRGGVEPQRVEGLGDVAVWLAGDLQVWAHGRKLRLSRPLANDPVLSRLLAERALARLAR